MRIGIANPDRSDDLPVAVRSLDLSPAQCAVIAESRAYAEAARRAGVVCLALLSGDGSTDQLRSAGARAVYRDAAELVDRLDAALTLASPGSAHLTYDLMESLMREALTVAEEGMRNGEAPIACVLARGDGKTIIARAHNEQNRTQNKTAHAEIVAFARAAGHVP
jgi:hypothetical protein